MLLNYYYSCMEGVFCVVPMLYHVLVLFSIHIRKALVVAAIQNIQIDTRGKKYQFLMIELNNVRRYISII